MALIDQIRKITGVRRADRRIASVDTEEKSSAAARLIHEDTNHGASNIFQPPSSGQGYGDLGISGDQSHDTMLGQYARSLWVYIAINRITNALNQISLRVVDKRKKGKANDEVKIGQGLVKLLEQPNPHTTRVEFLETIIQHLLLTGNAFIEKAETDSRGRPRELYILNPKNMVVIPDRKNFIKGYRYVVNDKTISFPKASIIHIKLPDPRGESRYGLSPIQAARSMINTDHQARSWNTSYFNNATWPSGIITSEEAMSETEFRRMKRELRQNYEGTSKVGKVLVLEGGLNWQQTTPNPKDLDWLNTLKNAREEILSLFGVPPSIAGVFNQESSSGRSAGVRDQSMQFWTNTVNPLLERVLVRLNLELSDLFSENYEIVGDTDKIPALKDTVEMQLGKAEAFKTLIDAGWPLNDALAEFYPSVKPFKHGDNPLPALNFNGEADKAAADAASAAASVATDSAAVAAETAATAVAAAGTGEKPKKDKPKKGEADGDK